MTVSELLIERIEALYPKVILLDKLSVRPRYAFLIARLINELSKHLEDNQCLEVYKIDYEPSTQLPTLHLISSLGVDDNALERIFDDITPLLQQVAKGERLTIQKAQTPNNQLSKEATSKPSDSE